MRVTLIILAITIGILSLAAGSKVAMSFADARTEDQFLRECLGRTDQSDSAAVADCHESASDKFAERMGLRLGWVAVILIALAHAAMAILLAVKNNRRAMRTQFIVCCIPVVSPFIVLGIPFGIIGLIAYAVGKKDTPAP